MRWLFETAEKGGTSFVPKCRGQELWRAKNGALQLQLVAVLLSGHMAGKISDDLRNRESVLFRRFWQVPPQQDSVLGIQTMLTWNTWPLRTDKHMEYNVKSGENGCLFLF